MSIQDIIVKILAQADQEASDILSQAEIDAANLREKILHEGEERRGALEQRAQEKITRAAQKAEALAHMEGKNQLLRKKQDLLTSVLSAVVEKLEKMPAKDYEQLLAKLMERIDVEDAVVYPAKGKENSTKGAVKLAGKKFRVGDSKDFIGGFTIESDTADFDFTFETLVYKMFRQDIEDIVKKEIF